MSASANIMMLSQGANSQHPPPTNSKSQGGGPVSITNPFESRDQSATNDQLSVNMLPMLINNSESPLFLLEQPHDNIAQCSLIEPLTFNVKDHGSLQQPVSLHASVSLQDGAMHKMNSATPRKPSQPQAQGSATTLIQQLNLNLGSMQNKQYAAMSIMSSTNSERKLKDHNPESVTILPNIVVTQSQKKLSLYKQASLNSKGALKGILGNTLFNGGNTLNHVSDDGDAEEIQVEHSSTMRSERGDQQFKSVPKLNYGGQSHVTPIMGEASPSIPNPTYQSVNPKNPYQGVKAMFSFYSESLQLAQNQGTSVIDGQTPRNQQASQKLVGNSNNQAGESGEKYKQLLNKITEQNTSSSSHSQVNPHMTKSPQMLQIQLPTTSTSQYKLSSTGQNSYQASPEKACMYPEQLLEGATKYLIQPSYARLMNVIYHVNREVKLDYGINQITQSPQKTGPNQHKIFITQEQLNDFYSRKVKNFPGLGRELEIVEEPEGMFAEMQGDVSTCSEGELKVQQQILSGITQQKLESELTYRQNPILIRYVRESTIFFNSRFESGNLREVERIHEYEYNLFLNFDFNTLNYTQWYFFSVRNIKKGFTYKFNIMNLQKDDSSYNYGMKPFVYSMKKNDELGTNTWDRGCDNIEYYKNNLKTKLRECAPDYEYDEASIPYYVYEDAESQMMFMNTLSFTYTFEYDEDIVFFSYFQPYTHTDLLDYLFSITKKHPPEYLKSNYKVQKLCNTLEGNICHLITITDNIQNEQQAMSLSIPQPAGKEPKQVIYLTSRVHPGEANSSFMIQGCIDFLLNPTNKEAQQLREQFIFKIVPMINPDGVIRGNYRCNTLGVDLNRRWQNPSKVLHPTIFFCKQLAKNLSKDGQIILYCDMHGHSRKRNVFMYGCVSVQSDLLQHRNNNLIKLIPYMLGQKNKFFQFNDCKFANEKEKESTARLVMFREFSVLNSYTLESTFYAMYNKETFRKKRDVENEQQIRGEDLLQVGADLCLTVAHILQSKILRKKFLQQQDTGAVALGNQASNANASGGQPPQALNQSMISDKEAKTGRDSIYPQAQIKDLLQQAPLIKQNYNSQNSQPINIQNVGPQEQIQHSATQHQFMIKQQHSMPPASDQPGMNLFYPNSNISLKKRSQRTLVPGALAKEQTTNPLLPQTEQTVASNQPSQKRKSSVKVYQQMATNPIGHATVSGSAQFQFSQMTLGAQNTKIAIKQSIMKQNIIEPPTQVNAILVNQFVHLSRGAKATNQELFKVHNHSQIKGLASAVGKNSAPASSGATQLSPEKRNIIQLVTQSQSLNTRALVYNNQQQAPSQTKAHSVRGNVPQNQISQSLNSNMPLSALLGGGILPNGLFNPQQVITPQQLEQLLMGQANNQIVLMNMPQGDGKLPQISQKQGKANGKQSLNDSLEVGGDTPSKKIVTNTPLKILELSLQNTPAPKSSHQIQMVQTLNGHANTASKAQDNQLQPQVLRQTVLVFNASQNSSQSVEQLVSNQSASMPRMTNPVIQRALEQQSNQYFQNLNNLAVGNLQVQASTLFAKKQGVQGGPNGPNSQSVGVNQRPINNNRHATGGEIKQDDGCGESEEFKQGGKSGVNLEQLIQHSMTADEEGLKDFLKKHQQENQDLSPPKGPVLHSGGEQTSLPNLINMSKGGTTQPDYNQQNQRNPYHLGSTQGEQQKQANAILNVNNNLTAESKLMSESLQRKYLPNSYLSQSSASNQHPSNLGGMSSSDFIFNSVFIKPQNALSTHQAHQTAQGKFNSSNSITAASVIDNYRDITSSKKIVGGGAGVLGLPTNVSTFGGPVAQSLQQPLGAFRATSHGPRMQNQQTAAAMAAAGASGLQDLQQSQARRISQNQQQQMVRISNSPLKRRRDMHQQQQNINLQ